MRPPGWPKCQLCNERDHNYDVIRKNGDGLHVMILTCSTCKGYHLLEEQEKGKRFFPAIHPDLLAGMRPWQRRKYSCAETENN